MLTVCRIEPNMVSVNGIFFGIENWLKELFVFENQRNFAIPILSALSSFKTLLETLINISKMQPKNLLATDMEGLYFHCG